MVDNVNSQAHLARNFYRAGNLQRAKDICQEILQKQPNHWGAFTCLFDVYFERDELQANYDLCLKRLEQNPECPDSLIYQVIAYGRLCNSKYNYISHQDLLRIKGEHYLRKINTRLSNYPLKLSEAKILHSDYFLGSKQTLKLIKQARKIGKLSPKWLDSIESNIHVRNKNLLAAKKVFKKRLTDDPLNARILKDYAELNFFCGQLLSAIKYARQAKSLNPKNAKACQEIIIFALISLCPLFWLGHIIIFATLIISSQFKLKYAYSIKRYSLKFIPIIYFYLLLLLDPKLKQLISNTDIRIVADLALTFIIYKWAKYLMFSFGNISRRLEEKRVSVKLSPEY